MMSMQGIAEIPNAPSIIKETESSMAVKVEESAEPVRNTEANTTSAAQITPTQSTSPSSQSAIIKAKSAAALIGVEPTQSVKELAKSWMSQ
jgi:hypothetical protein